jgi:hypothetical protein
MGENAELQTEELGMSTKAFRQIFAMGSVTKSVQTQFECVTFCATLVVDKGTFFFAKRPIL